MALKYLSVLVLLACVLLVAESMPRHHNIQKRGMRLCGSRLVDALAVACQNEYYDPNRMQMRKRNYAYSADAFPGWDSSITDFDGFVDPQTALDFLGVQLPRNARGIADECCKKTCNFNQLLSYCGPNALPSGEKK